MVDVRRTIGDGVGGAHVIVNAEPGIVIVTTAPVYVQLFQFAGSESVVVVVD